MSLVQNSEDNIYIPHFKAKKLITTNDAKYALSSTAYQSTTCKTFAGKFTDLTANLTMALSSMHTSTKAQQSPLIQTCPPPNHYPNPNLI